MTLSEDLAWRGLIKDKTFGDIAWLDEPKKFYLGMDASSDSFTIGNLAVLILFRRLVDAGWEGVMLAGGATSLIGDPGGKEEERKLKSQEEIAGNIAAIKGQIEQILAGEKFELVDNYEWFSDVKFLDFLRDVGKNYSMSELIQREFVSERLGEGGAGISYAEFSYSLIQGYDFWYLFKHYGVVLQIGASDQWGNMLSGVPLIRKKENKEAHAFSMPLVINKQTGRKFGKSEEGAVWLDPAKTSPFKFYQLWINADDDSVEDYLKIYTLLSQEEIESLIDEFKQNPAGRSAQKVLAYEVTKIVHGEEQADRQRNVADSLFTGQGIDNLAENELDVIRKEFPNLTIPSGMPIIEILVSTGLAQSNSEARRLKESGAVYINNEKFDQDHIEASHFNNKRLLIRRGKAFKDSALIELQ
jgi:tyrosyl-tRNA synthetase